MLFFKATDLKVIGQKLCHRSNYNILLNLLIILHCSSSGCLKESFNLKKNFQLRRIDVMIFFTPLSFSRLLSLKKGGDDERVMELVLSCHLVNCCGKAIEKNLYQKGGTLHFATQRGAPLLETYGRRRYGNLRKDASLG